MVKYKQYYQQMADENTALFARFKEIHDQFVEDRVTWSDQFNLVGQQVVDVIRVWDKRLCSAMNRGVYSGYSQQLSEKFWAEVKKHFSHIDMVGVKIVKRTATT